LAPNELEISIVRVAYQSVTNLADDRVVSRLLYSHKWMALREGLHGAAYVSSTDGGTGTIIVPVLPSSLINLVVETSYVDGSRCIGLPAGTVEAAESLQACAERELREETALRVKSIEELGIIHLMQRYADLKGHVFLAHVEPGEPVARDEPYEINNLPVSWEQIHGLIASGELTDSSTIASLFLAKRALLDKA
jgi:ADP-ribose pyrophosphatase